MARDCRRGERGRCQTGSWRRTSRRGQRRSEAVALRWADVEEGHRPDSDRLAPAAAPDFPHGRGRADASPAYPHPDLFQGYLTPSAFMRVARCLDAALYFVAVSDPATTCGRSSERRSLRSLPTATQGAKCNVLPRRAP